MEHKNILHQGKNCWRIEGAHRVAFLIDAAAYFEAFVEAVKRARKSILIVGWDIDSRVCLWRGETPREWPAGLGDFLNEVVSRRPGLHANVLAWDFAMIYALERELLPIFKFGLGTHPRLHFSLDGNHPLGASHHQKIVVVDDAVAFVGGIDLTRCRWDTPEHRMDEPLRVDSSGRPYPPFHDVQMLVDGKVAQVLGDLVRERWLRSTGHRLEAPNLRGMVMDPWPVGVTPDLEDVSVAIARTEPAFDGYPEVREIEALYVTAIAAARRHIYIENQYVTSAAVTDVLAQCLQEENGPEVVLVLPLRSSGWLEEQTMDALRAYRLRQLHAADRFDRLRVFYPQLPGLGTECLLVHAKVLVVDDTLVRVGSSNLSNRSLGFDTECDLALEAAGQPRIEEAIASFRNRLLGEHLDVDPAEVGAMWERHQRSLIAAVDALRGAARTLRTLDFEMPDFAGFLVQGTMLIDPERPVDAEELIEQLVPDEVPDSGYVRAAGNVSLLLFLVCLALFWYWTPLKDWLDIRAIMNWAHSISDTMAAPVVMVAAFLLGGLVVFPVTVLIFATAVLFEPLTAFIYSLLGCVASAFSTYAFGRFLGRETVRRFAGRRINRLSRQLARRGLITMLTVRLLPVAPFTIVNVVAGASHIRFKDYALGTVIGMLPGILAITLFGETLENAFLHPGMKSYAILLALLVLIATGSVAVHHWLSGGESGTRSVD